MGRVFDATERELSRLPADIADSALAASALELADQLDSRVNSATSKSMCAKAHLDLMNRIRELAPPVEQKGPIDEIKERRERRRRRAAGENSGSS